MPQFAPVAPPSILKLLAAEGPKMLGKYHLMLAHDVAKYPEAYQGVLPRDAFIIMDNSLIELGEPVDSMTMSKACGVMNPSVIVLPDHLMDMEKTIRASRDGAERYRLSMDQMFMVVPQGRNMEELLQCAKELASIPNVGCMGVGRFVTEKVLGSRVKFTQELLSMKDLLKAGKSRHGPFLHMLGFSDNLEDDLLSAKLPGVMGIDSAVPLRMGQLHELMDYRVDYKEFPTPPRGDYWTAEWDFLTSETLANLTQVRAWLNWY